MKLYNRYTANFFFVCVWAQANNRAYILESEFPTSTYLVVWMRNLQYHQKDDRRGPYKGFADLVLHVIMEICPAVTYRARLVMRPIPVIVAEERIAQKHAEKEAADVTEVPDMGKQPDDKEDDSHDSKCHKRRRLRQFRTLVQIKLRHSHRYGDSPRN